MKKEEYQLIESKLMTIEERVSAIEEAVKQILSLVNEQKKKNQRHDGLTGAEGSKAIPSDVIARQWILDKAGNLIGFDRG